MSRQSLAGNGEFRVERLRYRDISSIAALERLVFSEPMSLGNLWRHALSDRTAYLVIHRHNTVIAYFGFTFCERYAHVLANATHPDYRRQGLAHRLLSEGEQVARARSARAFIGEVRCSNLVQLKALQAMNWHIAGQMLAFFGNGENAYVVIKVFD